MNVWIVRVGWAWVVVASLILIAPGATAQDKHHVTLSDLEGLKYADYLQLSPNGKMLVYTVGGSIWMVATRPASISHNIGKGDDPVWSPDNRSLAFVSNGSGKSQVRVFDRESGHVEQVTDFKEGIDAPVESGRIYEMGDPFNLRWSPDSRSLTFHSRVIVEAKGSQPAGDHSLVIPDSGAKGIAPLVLTTKTPPEWTLSGVFSHGFGPTRWSNGKWGDDPHAKGGPPPKRVSQLFVVNVQSKKVSQLTHDDAGYYDPDWSPNGKKIVCVSNEGREQTGYAGYPNVYVIEIATGKKRVLTTGLRDRWYPRWSPNGEWIAYWDGERVGTHAVSVIPATGGAPPKLIWKLDRYAFEFYWSQDSESIVVNYQDGVGRGIARVNARTSDIHEISENNDNAFRWLMTASLAGAIAWAQSDGSSCAVIYFMSADPGLPYTLVDLNPQVKEWAIGAQEVIRWKSNRGDEREGILIKPVGYREGHRYPIIVDVYPNIGSWFQGGVMSGNQAWASRGYAVFFPNPRPPHNWMIFAKEADRDAARGPSGWDVAMDDVMSGVDELIRRGIVDPDRLGLYGFSNGGGVANYLVTRTNRFKCAVSVAGAGADWVRLPLLYSDFSSEDYLGIDQSMWDNPDTYIRLSAVFHLNKVTTPMLLADGDEDEGNFLLDSIEMYNGLRRFGQDVILLRYPHQNHGFTGTALRDFWTRENAFFDKYLSSSEGSN